MRDKSVLERLEKWKNSSKAHDIKIDHPNSYGAGCWNLTLGGAFRYGGVHVHGVSFYSYKNEELPENVVYIGMIDYIAEDGEEDERWPTLEECIEAGLKRYSELKQKMAKGEPVRLWDARTKEIKVV